MLKIAKIKEHVELISLFKKTILLLCSIVRK